MSKPIDVLGQDFDAILKAFDAEEFGLMQILSNRLMSNMTFFKPTLNFLPAYICKDIATIFERMKIQKGSALSTSKVTIKPILLELNEVFKNYSPKDQVRYWEIFDKLNKEMSARAQHKSN